MLTAIDLVPVKRKRPAEFAGLVPFSIGWAMPTEGSAVEGRLQAGAGLELRRQEALVLIVSPVRGLRASPAGRLVTRKVPKPTRRTSSPFFRDAVIASSTASTRGGSLGLVEVRLIRDGGDEIALVHRSSPYLDCNTPNSNGAARRCSSSRLAMQGSSWIKLGKTDCLRHRKGLRDGIPEASFRVYRQPRATNAREAG